MVAEVAAFTATIIGGGAASVATAAAIATGIRAVFYVAAINNYLKRKQEKPKAPSVSDNKVIVHEANPDRKIFYGRTTIAPSIVYAQNPDDLPGVEFYCAVADHSFNLHNVKINGDNFFSSAEMEAILELRHLAETTNSKGISTIFIVCEKYNNENDYSFLFENKHRQTRRITNFNNSSDGYSDFRKSINENCNDWGQNTMLMEINWGFGSFAGDVNNGGTRFGSLRYFRKPNGFRNWVDAGMGFSGVSWFAFAILGRMSRLEQSKRRYFGIVGPRVSTQVSKYIFQSTPNLTLEVSRDRDTLLLWDKDSKIPTEYTTDNASLCIYDFLKRYTAYRDSACGIDRIDKGAAKAAAQVSHDKGYTANGVISLAHAPIEVLDQLSVANGSGECVDVNGIMHIKPGVYSTPTAYITDESHIDINSWSLTANAPIEQRKGVFQVNYLDTEGNEQSVSVDHTLSRTPAVAEKDAVFINNEQQAKNVAYRLASLAWDTDYISFTTDLDFITLKPFDLIYINIIQLSLVRRLYRILSLEINDNNRLLITARSETKYLYNDVKADNFHPLNRPRTILPDTLLAITGSDNDKGAMLLNNSGGRLKI